MFGFLSFNAYGAPSSFDIENQNINVEQFTIITITSESSQGKVMDMKYTNKDYAWVMIHFPGSSLMILEAWLPLNFETGP
jgi:hypothetical protein